jgi:serine/threonine protein phosphatase PrpC
MLASPPSDVAFEALDLTVDHKADRPDEQERMEKAGGQIQPSRTIDEVWEPARLYEDLENTRRGPGLTMSRAFGDWGSRPLGFSATPELTRHELQPDDRFIIVASDGLWELIDSDLAVEIVGAMYEGGQPAQLAALALITAAANRWFVLEGFGYRDDITCVIVFLELELLP